MRQPAIGIAFAAVGLLCAFPAHAQLPPGPATITINGTQIINGTNGLCLYDNNGKVGEQACGSSSAITALTGDVTATGPGSVPATLASIISAGGPTGSATVAPIITYDAKGRLTAVSSATITPAISNITGLGTNCATWLATPSSANLAACLTDETGTAGSLVFNLSPALITPTFTTSFTSPLQIGGTGTGSSATIQSTSGVGATDFINFLVGNNGATEAMRIITSGRILEGSTTPQNTSFSVSPFHQIHSISGNVWSGNVFSEYWWGGAVAGGVNHGFNKSRGSTIGTHTVVASGDTLGTIVWNGSDGTQFIPAAFLGVIVDGTPGTNDMPGRFAFSTTLDGAASPTLRMSIFNDGGVLIGSSTTSPGAGNFEVDAQVYLTAISSDTATTDATVCIATGSSPAGKVLKGTGALGICLGTSGRQFKTGFAPMTAGLDDLMKISFQNYHYRKGFGDDGDRLQYGTTAQDVEGALPDLVRRDAGGAAINYDSGALLFIGLRAIQQLKTGNDSLHTANEALSARVSKVENMLFRCGAVGR